MPLRPPFDDNVALPIHGNHLSIWNGENRPRLEMDGNWVGRGPTTANGKLKIISWVAISDDANEVKCFAGNKIGGPSPRRRIV